MSNQNQLPRVIDAGTKLFNTYSMRGKQPEQVFNVLTDKGFIRGSSRYDYAYTKSQRAAQKFTRAEARHVMGVLADIASGDNTPAKL